MFLCMGLAPLAECIEYIKRTGVALDWGALGLCVGRVGGASQWAVRWNGSPGVLRTPVPLFLIIIFVYLVPYLKMFLK